MIAGYWFNHSLWSRASRVTEGLNHLLYDPTDGNDITHGAKCQRRHTFERKLNEGCRKHTRGVEGSSIYRHLQKMKRPLKQREQSNVTEQEKKAIGTLRVYSITTSKQGQRSLGSKKCTLYIYAALSVTLIWLSDWLGWRIMSRPNPTFSIELSSSPCQELSMSCQLRGSSITFVHHVVENRLHGID